MPPTRILVITPQYAPDFGPSAPIYTALCEDLQQMGCDVTAITGFPHYGGSSGWYPYAKKWFVEEKLNGVRVLRTYIFEMPKGALWKRLLYHAWLNFSSTLAALSVKKPDIVLADAPMLWSGLPLLVAAIFRRVPFVYVVHDIYPDVLLRLGVLRNPRLIDWIGRLEAFFYDRSAQVSVLSAGFKENLLRKGVPEDKINVIPACVDVELIRPLCRENELRERWGLGEKFVVLYAGNMGLSQGLETLLHAAQSLAHEDNIMFILVGEGANKPALEAAAKEMGLSNVKFFSFLPREEVPMIYALADICLVSLKRDIVVESVPSKTYTILASGRPIVATVDPNTETGRLIEQANCGLCVKPEDPQALVEAVFELYRDAALRREMGERGRDFAVAHYSRSVAAGQYYQLVQRYSDHKIS